VIAEATASAPVRLAALVRGMAEAAAAMPVTLLAVLFGLTGAAVMSDTQLSDSGAVAGATFALSIAQLVAELIVYRTGLARLSIWRTGGAGIGGLFLLGIPLNLGVGIGLLLLVLPGLYLSARWRLALPGLVAGDLTIGEALRASWDRTAPHWRPLMIASALVGVPLVASAVVLATGSADDGRIAPLPSLAANLLLYGAILAGWLLDLSAYRLIVHSTADLAETFA
jgi:hypothetical protein